MESAVADSPTLSLKRKERAIRVGHQRRAGRSGWQRMRGRVGSGETRTSSLERLRGGRLTVLYQLPLEHLQSLCAGPEASPTLPAPRVCLSVRLGQYSATLQSRLESLRRLRLSCRAYRYREFAKPS